MASKRDADAFRAEMPKQQINPWLALAQAVVYQAILDWYRLDSGKTVPRTNYTSLRGFFSSDWCEQLLLYTDIHPSRILAKMERHTKEVNP